MSTSNSHSTFDQAQFEQLFKQHFAHLTNFARQYVGDADTAQDLAQKVFISLWENREKIDPSQNIVSYIFTAAKNRSLNFIRDNKKYRSRILDLDGGDFDVAEAEENFAFEELQEKVDVALKSLPDKCRQVFEMSRFKNMKYREIAEELGVSQKTVEAHMSRAMKGMREALGGVMMIAVLVGLL